ncbi:MAG: serine hydrolase [Burkholderiaceae bacterium]|nr:serine hydrolase [Burkholderiaceae bacterium]
MRLVLAAFLACLSMCIAVPAAAAAPCETPARADDGWRFQTDPAQAGFSPQALCDALRAFAGSPRNLHSLVVERSGELVAEAYRAGDDRSTYSLFASRTAFDASTPHDVRSVTKSVVALLWGIAQGEGAVPPVDTPVLDLLPALADLRSDGREHITVRDLLCMRSGLAWDESGGYSRPGNDARDLLWRGDIARHVLGRRLQAAPGQQFNYNSGLSAVLAQLLEARTGQDLQDYARQKLFAPLGIESWEWGRDLRQRTRGDSGLRLRPRDMVRIGRLMLDGGRWQGRQLVPQDWVRAAVTPCVAGAEYGYQWWAGRIHVDGRPVGWQGALGNGGQRVFLVPALDLVVVATAGEYNDGSIGRIQRSLLEQVVVATREHAAGATFEAAGPTAGAPAPPAAGTRAELRSVTHEAGKVYAYLKILPGAKVPFSTLRFRVRDQAMLAGLESGTNVKFSAERVDGENTLVTIRAVAACVRFQPCE